MKVHVATVSNIEKYGSAPEAKLLSSNKSLFNFYMVVAILLTMIAAYLNLLKSSEVFVALFVAELLGLGIKLSFDVKS